MKRIAVILLTAAAIFCLASCGAKEEVKAPEDDGTYEVAMITDNENVNDGGFNQSAWKSIKRLSAERNLSCGRYSPKEATEKAYLNSVAEALENGAELVIFSGSDFETAVYEAQSEYPETYFLLIDGVPHSEKGTYATGKNTISIMFAEEEAGFLAGYSAVADGYKNIGFMGGKELPPVKRYGYGFVQGAAMAAEELADKNSGEKVQIRYVYTGTFDESKDVKEQAEKWYEDGTQVIFSCGGAMNKSVAKAAEAADGKVIGADTDQSGMSETVITSAEKNISSAVENVLRDYAGDKFVGGMAFNYAAKNDGVKLSMKKSKFTVFTADDYKKIFKMLKNGKIKLKKDTEVKSLDELKGSHTEIKQ